MALTDLARSLLITFDLPFMINLPDGEYTVNIEYVQVLIILMRKQGNPKGVPDGVVLPPDSYVMGDRWGRFQYTQLAMQVNLPIFVKIHVNLPDYMLETCAKIVNRISGVCRGVRGDHYTRIIPADIFSYNIGYIDTNGQVRPLVFGTAYGNRVMMGGAGEPTEEETTKIKKVLKENAKLPIFQEILFNAYDYHFYGDYRAAVIEANTAFQVFVENLIIDGYKNMGKNEDFIKNQLDAGFKNLLKDHIKKVRAHDFYSTPLYDDWEKLAYKVRNDVVHKGRNVTGDVSKIAIETTAKAIRFLHT